MPERRERCDACRFWNNPRDNGYGFGSLVGNCRRFPPTWLRYPQKEGDEPHEDTGFAGFVPTDSDDWCGEWSPLT